MNCQWTQSICNISLRSSCCCFFFSRISDTCIHRTSNFPIQTAFAHPNRTTFALYLKRQINDKEQNHQPGYHSRNVHSMHTHTCSHMETHMLTCSQPHTLAYLQQVSGEMLSVQSTYTQFHIYSRWPSFLVILKIQLLCTNFMFWSECGKIVRNRFAMWYTKEHHQITQSRFPICHIT